MRDIQDLADSNEPLFVDRCFNENYFTANLHEGGITGVARDKDDQDDDNDNDNINTN